ncbi:MAG: glycosyl hydrolase [Bacteroidetes bacterium]|nr:MAG: glycosyl hydrolase [Bacteroidota bacterium]
MKRRKNLLAISCVFAAALSLTAQNWSHVGPVSNNFTGGNLFQTGRLDCIALDNGFDGTTNQTIYAGGTAGSLWKTTDMGANWARISIPDHVKYQGISALCMLSTGTMLVATMNTGYVKNQYDNIYQYVPATSTWTSTGFAAATGSPTYVNHIRYCPGNPSIVFAATSTGLYKSTNSGTSWALVPGMTGIYENVDFVPANWATGGYQVFVCGAANIMVSTDMGATFSMKTSITSLLFKDPSGPDFYVDMSITYDFSSTGTRYVYFDVLEFHPYTFTWGIGYIPYHHIVRLSTDVLITAETVYDIGATANGIGLVHDAVGSTDRMCVAAHDQVAYFGCGGLMKYNTVMNRYYRVSSGLLDIVEPLLNCSMNMNDPAHMDNHDIMTLPALNKIIYVNDGGFYTDSYTIPVPATHEYVNNWTRTNNKLNVSQIWGLSCAEDDTTMYMTGEQDIQGGAMITSAAASTFYGAGTEPSIVLIDKFNKNNYMHSDVASNNNIVGMYNAGFISSLPYAPVASATSICNSVYSDCGGFSCFPGPEFSSNTLFQDPNRPDKIYFGVKNGGLLEFCPSTRKFVLKKGFNVGPTTWNQFVNGIAFSRKDKNKVHVLLSGRDFGTPGQFARPEVFAFTGPDFDNSWAGYNDGTWANITPNFTLSPFTVPLTPAQETQVQFLGIAASDWNADRIFVALREVPGNPGLKVIKRENNTWTDYSTGVPADESPISLVYEQGTNDQMYLGTNVNVYYRNATMSSWVLYSGVLPNLAMNQLRVNYSDNTVRVGTYGQGMWKSNLRCPSILNAIESGAMLVDKFVEVEKAITATVLTTNNNTIIYRAGDYIDLLPSYFEAVQSAGTSMFYAYIHGCNGPGNTFRSSAQGEEWMMDAARETITEAKEEDKIKTAFVVYPNPSEGIFYLEKGSDLPADIDVFDLMGRKILSLQNVTDMKTKIDLGGQSKGIFLLKVKIGDEVKTERIIRQ